MFRVSDVGNALNKNIVVVDQKIVEKVYPSINLIDDIKTTINEYNNQFEFPFLQFDELI